MSPPFHRSYWAIPGKLLAGCYPGDLDPAQADAKLNALITSGVTLFVNLMEETETDHSGNPFDDYVPRLTTLANAAGKSIRMERYPIRDQSIPAPAQMQSILDTIDGEIEGSGIVYVHCWGGKGRTATVVGCYLLSSGYESHTSILEILRERTSHASKFFWPTPQTLEQGRFITSWGIH